MEMGWFRRRRKKKELLQEPQNEWEQAENSPADPALDQREIGHHVLDHCEQIIEAAREVSEERKEYDIVTSY